LPRLRKGKSLLEISDDVLDVLASDRDANEFRAKTLFLHDFERDGSVGHAARVLDEGVETAKRYCEGSQLGVLDNTLGRLETVLHDEGERSTIAALHLSSCALVVRRALETGIGHTGNLGMLLKELGDLLSILVVLLHAHGKSADATEHKEGIERTHDASSVLTPLADKRSMLRSLGNNNSADNITVAVEILGDAVEHNISTQNKRILEDGRSEGVVDNKNSTGFVGNLGNLTKICDSSKRVARSLYIHNLGLTLLDTLTHLFGVGSVNDSGLDTVAAQDVAKVVHSGSVHNLAADSMVTSLQEGEHSTSNGTHARREGNASVAVLKIGNSHLKLLNGGIAHARIDVALTLLAKEIRTHLRVIKDKSAGLEDREGVSVENVLLVAACDGLASCVDAKSVKTFFRHTELYTNETGTTTPVKITKKKLS